MVWSKSELKFDMQNPPLIVLFLSFFAFFGESQRLSDDPQCTISLCLLKIIENYRSLCRKDVSFVSYSDRKKSLKTFLVAT